MEKGIIVLIAYVGYLALVSLVTFCLFLKDKKMAQKGGGPVRIKEKTLLGATVFGGAIGAFIGRLVAHHKTDKKYFSFTIYVSLLLEAVCLAVLIILAFNLK
ncbi:MAG: DUF1294 domain-containing protein [Acholeplasmatales bacterium]|nr:DUF1294 domain-containing protein [Acholeplasmatales bacterium]